MNSLSIINRDGSGLRQLVPDGYSAAWSADGRLVYYSRRTDDAICIEKMSIEGGPAISVRCDNAVAAAPAPDGSALYFANYLAKTNGIVDYELRGARPENGPSEVLARVAGSRVPVNRRQLVPVLSPDGRWLTMPLLDGATSNIWVLPTNGERCGLSPTLAIAPSSSPAASRGRPTASFSTPPWRTSTPTSSCWRACSGDLRRASA